MDNFLIGHFLTDILYRHFVCFNLNLSTQEKLFFSILQSVQKLVHINISKYIMSSVKVRSLITKENRRRSPTKTGSHIRLISFVISERTLCSAMICPDSIYGGVMHVHCEML